MVIVVDFDGTLALGDTSSIPEMLPNAPLVSIINEMHTDGNTINVVTARGSKSCSSFTERKEKYFKVITRWLEENNVSYDKLSFFKEYGDVYFDDKCHNIENTIQYKKLDSAFTKNKVRRLNDFVVKTCSSSTEENFWYNEANKIGVKTPELLSYDQDTITTKYISGARFDDPNLSLSLLHKFKNAKALNGCTFSTYVDRIKRHLENNHHIVNSKKMMECLISITIPPSFNHGDFSIDNMIQKDGSLYLIDPIFSRDCFQSYCLDISKHLFSILYYDLNYNLYRLCRDIYLKNFGIDEKTLEILVCAESIRVATYKKQFSSISNNLIDQLRR